MKSVDKCVFRLFCLSMLLFPTISHAGASISDPLWDWKYDALERVMLAAGERTVSNTRPMSRVEMADMTIRLSGRVERMESSYHEALLKRLEDDLREEIEDIKRGERGRLRIRPVGWIRAKAVYGSSPFQLENDSGFKAGEPSARGEVSTSGTWGPIGWELIPRYDFYKADAGDGGDGKFDISSGYLVLWLKNLELKVGKDSLWWGPGRRGSLILTNNAPAFELVKMSNAVAAVPPGPFGIMGDTKFTAFLGRISEQTIVYGDNGERVEEKKKPLFAGFRLDFSPSRHVEVGFSETVQFIDRGGRGYDADYIVKTFLPSWESNEEEASSGPVANRIVALDISINFSGEQAFMRTAGLEGMKLYWQTGGETMGTYDDSSIPRTSNTANILGIYLDTGKADFRVEYASNYDSTTEWYSHYQFTEGYRNEGFVSGHHMGGYGRDLFLNLSYPLSSTYLAAISFNREEHKEGQVSRLDTFGLSVGRFLKKGGKVGLTYEYRDKNINEDINQVGILEGVYKF